MAVYHSNLVVKEESVSNDDFWQYGIKHEPISPLSTNSQSEDNHKIDEYDKNIEVFMGQANMLKEESVSSGEFLLYGMKQEPESHLPMNMQSEGCDETYQQVANVKVSMNQANIAIKEESVSCDEFSQGSVKLESMSPLSTNFQYEENDEIDEHEEKVSMDETNIVVKEESVCSDEFSMESVKQEPASPLSMNMQSEDCDKIDEQQPKVKEFVEQMNVDPLFKCCAGSCTLQISCPSIEPHSLEAVEELNQAHFLKDSFCPQHQKLCGKSEYQKVFHVASSSTADVKMVQQESADIYLSERPVEEKIARVKQNKHRSEGKSCVNNKVVCFDNETQKSASSSSPSGEEKGEIRRRNFKCSTCKMIFTQKRNLSRHMLAHTNESPFKCGDCGKSFKRKDALILHSRTHMVEMHFKCSQCGKFLSCIRSLNIHMRIHTGERPYKCSQCGKSFAISGRLTAHLRSHSGNRPYKCSLCDKSFKEKQHLFDHIDTHSGNRSYICSECGKSYVRRSSLYQHLVIHRGKKPFICRECGKSFTRSTILSQHILTHTGEKPYKCSLCDKCFTRNSSLKRHMQTHMMR